MFISIELNFGKKSIVCVTACYRVGTLGDANHKEIDNHLRKIAQQKKFNKHVIVGDFNLSKVAWPVVEYSTISSIERSFVESFSEFGLSQCVLLPSHEKGKTLDLLLTNYPGLINNLNVLKHNSICKSDHFPITFDLKINIKLKKSIKRKIYNFKRANWDALNHELRHVEWDAMLDGVETELGWSTVWLCQSSHS